MYIRRAGGSAHANFSTADNLWIRESRENRTARSGCATSTLRGLARCDSGVEFRGFAARDRQCIPIRPGEMFGEEDDLPDVVGIMRQLTVNGLHDGVRLGANVCGAGEIGVRERGQCVKGELP